MRQKGFAPILILVLAGILLIIGYFAFRFYQLKNQAPVENKFCGGIAGNLPENQCPAGYTCKLSGNNPDASGTCVKN